MSGGTAKLHLDQEVLDAVCARMLGPHWYGLPAATQFRVREQVLTTLTAARHEGWSTPAELAVVNEQAAAWREDTELSARMLRELIAFVDGQVAGLSSGTARLVLTTPWDGTGGGFAGDAPSAGLAFKVVADWIRNWAPADPEETPT